MIKSQFPLLIFISVCIASCSGKQDASETDKNSINKAFLENVKTAKSVLSNQEEELTLTGKVECDPDMVINYTPLVSGIVERTYFSLGDKVQKGQTMMDIKGSDLSSLQSEYTSTESELKIAQRELETAQSMFDDKMLSEKELLEAKAKVKQVQATFSKIENDMSVFGTNKGNGVFSIKAPISGYIIDKKVSSGSPISTDSEPLFTIADLRNVWITANVYASNLQFVKEGMNVTITTLSYPDEVFEGKINTLSQVFDPEEKVLKARIVMPNNNLKFKPEMSAVIRIKNETHSKAVSIPSDALIFDDDQYFVVVEQSPDNFEIRKVELQGHNRGTTYIRSGLSENENVVIKNQLLIYSGLNQK